MKRLTLEEIGKLAGVSRATVSRVINNHPNISPAVRERVQKVIEETGYQPNLLARSLASRETKMIGLIIPSVIQEFFSDPYYPRLTQGVAQAINDNHYTLNFFLFQSKKEEQRALQRIVGNGLVDGLIVAADNMVDPFVPSLVEQNVPVVLVGRPSQPRDITFVDVDNVRGGYLATKHLIECGRSRIAEVSALPFLVAVDRDRGYRDALRDAGHDIDERLIAIGDFTELSGYHAMNELIPRKPDGVFVHSDQMAVGALRALREAGLRVPEDVAVIGFDDLPPATQSHPTLTTISQPIRDTGSIAVETLIEILKSRLTTPKQIILPVHLKVRDSTSMIS